VKKSRRIVLIIGGVILLCLAALIATIVHVSTPTRGVPIADYGSPRAALLVIDVQNDTTSNTDSYGDTAAFVDRINQSISLAQAAGLEVVYVQQVAGKSPIVWLLTQGKYQAGSTGIELDENLLVVNGNVFVKHIGDSFSAEGFDDFLISKQVSTVYLVGADASACIYNTARGGLNRGYDVIVISDAIVTINEKTMGKMLIQYATDGIEVVDLAGFAAQIPN